MERGTSQVCAICQEPISDAYNIGQLPCGHAFHLGCLLKHSVSVTTVEEKKKCPVCRGQVGPFSFDKIRRKLNVLWGRDATMSAKGTEGPLPQMGSMRTSHVACDETGAEKASQVTWLDNQAANHDEGEHKHRIHTANHDEGEHKDSRHAASHDEGEHKDSRHAANHDEGEHKDSRHAASHDEREHKNSSHTASHGEGQHKNNRHAASYDEGEHKDSRHAATDLEMGTGTPLHGALEKKEGEEERKQAYEVFIVMTCFEPQKTISLMIEPQWLSRFVPPGAYAAKLMEMIEEKEGINFKELRLLDDDKLIEKEHKLADMGIQDGTKLRVVTRKQRAKERMCLCLLYTVVSPLLLPYVVFWLPGRCIVKNCLSPCWDLL